MKNTVTKTRKMMVKLVDEKGNVFHKIFPIELSRDFDTQNFNVERIEIAKEFVKPYPGALAKLASSLVASQAGELEKIKILANSTLDAAIKVKFISDYNAATANRMEAFNNLYPKAKAYRAEKGLRDITLVQFNADFSPINAKTKQKENVFRFVTLSDDQKSYSTNAVEATEKSEAAEK